MAALGEDHYQGLRSAVESWAAEVSQVRSALDDKLKAELRSARPAFRLHRDRVVPPREAPAPPASQRDAETRARGAQFDLEKKRLEQELDFVREQLLVLSREAGEAQLRAEEKSNALEEMARAFGRARLDLNEAIEQLRVKEWALLQAEGDNETLRAHAVAPARTVPIDEYDVLVESHISIRAEAVALQERIVQREHEILALRESLASAQAEVSAWESAGPASGAGIAKLAGVIAERSAALEALEATAQGQEMLIVALRQELDAARSTLDGRAFDQERLVRVLRAEIDGLRAVSSERDFVIGHQARSIESIASRETELEAELREARETGEALRLRAQHAWDEREELAREVQLLRAKAADRDAELWRHRAAAPATPAVGSPEPGLAQLQAALASRDAELARARQRIAFLRGQGRESAGLTAMARVFAPDAAPLAAAGERPRDTPPARADLDLDDIQPNSSLQREVEAALAAEFPWHFIAAVGGVAGLGLLVLGVLAMLLS